MYPTILFSPPKALNLQNEQPPADGHLASNECPGTPHGGASHLLIIGGSIHTNDLLRDAGLAATRFAAPDHLPAAFAQAGDAVRVVVSPLLAPAFDILDVIGQLRSLGFRGQLLAVSAPLPDATAVLRELRGECVGFRLDILQVGG